MPSEDGQSQAGKKGQPTVIALANVKKMIKSKAAPTEITSNIIHS